ncbi:hypothetical protein JRQ81_002718, partial [Phrynocephalus forsythii]
RCRAEKRDKTWKERAAGVYTRCSPLRPLLGFPAQSSLPRVKFSSTLFLITYSDFGRRKRSLLRKGKPFSEIDETLRALLTLAGLDL